MYQYKSELHLQSIIWQWFYNKYPEHRLPLRGKNPRCLLVHNLLNAKSVVEGAKLASCGLTKGFPDMSLHLPRKGFHGLHMELKLPGMKPKPEQLDVLHALEENGYYVCWVDNHLDAQQEIENYLND